MSNLKTNYKDAELSPSMNGKRQYELQYNEAGYTNLVDKTAYTEVGDTFGADDINATNSAVNELNQNLTDKTTWKYLGKTSGDNSIAVPSDYREILVYLSDQETTEYALPLYICKDIVDTGKKYFVCGFYYASSNYVGAQAYCDGTNMKVASYFSKGASILANARGQWFYR